MKVTVCELRNDPANVEADWDGLVSHVKQASSDLVLLPEMPFYPWVASTRNRDPERWQASVEAHEKWLSRFKALAPAVIFGTRPVIKAERFLNQGFVWDPKEGYQAIHTKYYLPDEDGFWEASCYERGDRDFEIFGSSGIKAGFLICTEIWFMEHAREYGKRGIQLLLCPRATPASSTDKWIAGGRAAAVVSGAFCLSSNRGGTDSNGAEWAGTGWIVEPEEGEVLGLTSETQPFLSIDIDLGAADNAKTTYPRYVLD